MNQDKVKEALGKIRVAKADYTLLFSGKQSIKVNGLYKPFQREIIIHNRNFTDDNMLMYTAIHEYAHHIHSTELGKDPSGRAHTVEYWALFHELLSQAEAADVYRNIFDCPELAPITGQIKDYLEEDGDVMRAIGVRLNIASDGCRKIHARFEDYIDRVIRMNRTTAHVCMKAAILKVDTSLGFDGMKLLAGITKEDTRDMAAAALDLGKTQAEVKALRKTPAAETDEITRMEKERARIERTIETLQRKRDDLTAALDQKKSA